MLPDNPVVLLASRLAHDSWHCAEPSQTLAFALINPAWTRSTSIARPNSANTPDIWNNALSAGPRVEPLLVQGQVHAPALSRPEKQAGVAATARCGRSSTRSLNLDRSPCALRLSSCGPGRGSVVRRDAVHELAHDDPTATLGHGLMGDGRQGAEPQGIRMQDPAPSGSKARPGQARSPMLSFGHEPPDRARRVRDRPRSPGWRLLGCRGTLHRGVYGLDMITEEFVERRCPLQRDIIEGVEAS